MSPSVYESLSQDAVAAAESLTVMMEKERTTYKSHDYLRPTRECASIIVTESDRLKIVDWCYSVVDRLELDRETVVMAMELVDRFLSSPSAVRDAALRDRGEYQLVAVAALYISVKTTERVALGSDFFAALSHGTYTVEDIEAMEINLLRGLSWRIFAPTPIQVAHHILSLTLPCAELQTSTLGFLLDEVRFQTEHAVRDYYFVTQRPSTIALAAVFNALEQIGGRDRREVLRPLLNVMDLEFDCPEILKAAKTRLHNVVVSNDAIVVEEDGEEDASSECPTVHDACSSEKRGPEESCDGQKASKRPAVILPDAYNEDAFHCESLETY